MRARGTQYHSTLPSEQAVLVNGRNRPSVSAAMQHTTLRDGEASNYTAHHFLLCISHDTETETPPDADGMSQPVFIK